jgi:recombination protein RecT
MTNALATMRDRYTHLASSLEKQRGQLAAVIPPAMAGLTPSRAIAVLLDACSRTPSLLDCDPKTLVRACVQAAEMGLELGSPLGEAYLVPFWSSRKQVKEAQCIPGYRGLIKLMSLDPAVSYVAAELVRQNDAFDYSLGTNPRIEHKPGSGDIRNRGDVTHAYAVIHYRHGGVPSFTVMDRAELDALEIDGKKKDKFKSGPWWGHTDEMRRKCPIRRLAKTARVSLHDPSLLSRAIEADEIADGRAEGRIAEGFSGRRAAEMREMLRAGDAPVVVTGEEVDE